jgi:hypothetical protein
MDSIIFYFLDRINPSTILQRQINLPELRGRQDFQDVLFLSFLKKLRKLNAPEAHKA